MPIQKHHKLKRRRPGGTAALAAGFFGESDARDSAWGPYIEFGSVRQGDLGDFQDNFADMGTIFHSGMGFGGLCQGEGGVNDGFYLARFKQRPDFVS